MALQQDSFVVEISRPGERLDTFLRGEFPAVSRGTFQRLIEQGCVTINGKPTKTTHQPRSGEKIDIIWPEARVSETRPENIPLDVLHEDEDLIVINKPPGIVVHPSVGHEEHTLVNALLHHCAGQLSGVGGVARPGIVHRLDQDTSGCLVVAKNDATHLALSEQFAGRTIGKIYHAIVCGSVTPEAGDIYAAIARHATERQRMAVTEPGEGRDAHTGYRILRRMRYSTLVEATLHTGRTHQIRVHFQHLRFPVLGDTVYGVRMNQRAQELMEYTVPRQMLHAYHLTFQHPKSGQILKIKAPWPADFQAAVDQLSIAELPEPEEAPVRGKRKTVKKKVATKKTPKKL